MKPWYRATLPEAQNYFDVNPRMGLSDQDVLERLKKFGPNIDLSLSNGLDRVYKVWVKRQGQRKRVSVTNIVPGDVVLLEPGCRVPADMRLFEVSDLEIDESALTGDYMPVAKNTYTIHQEKPMSEQKCMVFGGTFVQSGFGQGVVVARGDKMILNRQSAKKLAKTKFLTRIKSGKLKNSGIIINNPGAVNQLKKISLVFIDACLTNQEVADVIRKVQLSKNLPCKFVVSEAKAKMLQTDLPGTACLNVDNMAKMPPAELRAKIAEVQYITNPSSEQALKIVSTLQSGGESILWVTDGRQPILAVKTADVSLVFSSFARDDVIYRGSLVFPRSKIAILPRILYNTK